MTEPTIELYKIRDFGAKVNATIRYIRMHIKDMIVPVLLLVLPTGLIAGLSMKSYLGFSLNMERMADDPEASSQLFSEMMTSYGVLMLVSLLAISLYMLIVYGYMKDAHQAGGTRLSSGELFSKAFSRLPGAILLMILISIIVFLGMLVFFIPGIYLMIVLSLAMPIYIFENVSIGNALSRSFKLIKGKWWSTFGLLVVSSLIAAAVSYIFVIPGYILVFWEMFTSISENQADPGALAKSMDGFLPTIGLTFAMIGAYVCYIIPIIALAFQYSNLVERNEGIGLKQDIENFENLK